MRRSSALFCSMLALSALVPVATARGQFVDPAASRPGRDPKQPIDSEYTKKIKEYTTESFFLSPLVDYLPAKAGVPTPKAELGDIAGAPGKLPYSKEVYDYMRMLAKAMPNRVKVYSIGTTEEGREHIAVAIASDALMAKLEANKANLAKLADPRVLNMDDKQAQALIPNTAPVYYITGTIHSTEAGAPTALMELAYRLAVDDAPYVKHIRDNVITLITPIVEVDGRDRVVDVYKWKQAHPNDTPPNAIYWGHYVAHDNNRDAMGMTLKLTQNILNTYVDWNATVLHDLHESVAYMYDNTIGDGPYNSWLDPLVTNEWQMIGWNNVQEMTRYGMPGVFAHGTFDTWSPGYLMFIAATHNGISRLYETFGNGGNADTQERILGANDTQRTWYKQNPPLPRVMWSLRNNNNYEQTGLLVSLNYVAANKNQLLENFWEKSKRSILKSKTEGPAAYILTANDPRPGAQAELLRILQLQRVEVSRATAPFTVTLPVKAVAAAGGGRGGRGGRGGGAPPAADAASAEPVQQAGARTETRDFPAGSYIIRMDQPYSRIADALLDYQFWSPNDPQKTPYDDTGWTFPEGFNVQAVRVVDPKVLTVAMEPVKTTVKAPGGVTGSGSAFLINANGDDALITLRYKLKNADIQAAEDPFEAGGAQYKRGSFVIKGVSQSDLDAATKDLGLKATAVASAPSVKMHPVRAARVMIMHTWQSTQTEGWWRYAFDANGIPYDYLSTADVAKIPNLNAKYDVIIFGPGGGAGRSIIEGMPMWRNPIPWKTTELTPNLGKIAETDDMRPGLGWDGLENIEKFVKNGGVYIGSVASAQFAIDFGLTNGVNFNAANRGTVTGTFLRMRLVDDGSPITYGVPDGIAAYTDGGESFSVSAQRTGGRGGGGGGGGGGAAGGGRGGGGANRETGRGQPDDVDEVQGRPALEDRFKAPVRAPVQPWQYAAITEDALRNPLNIIPPDQRPRVAVRYSAQNDLLVSGLLNGGGDIAQRPAVVDSPLEKGHVVLFSINPIYRGETIGTYPLVFNTIMNFDNLNAGRKLDSK